MARYIDADAIRITADKTFRDADGSLLVRLEDVRRAIEQTPTADVQEVKHGKWIYDRDFYGLYNCSECGRRIEFNSVVGHPETVYPYCHCGARMDGDEK